MAATRVSVRAELVRRARALGIDVSKVLESALELAIRDADRARWLDENREAFDAYNEHVAKHGVFGYDWRRI